MRGLSQPRGARQAAPNRKKKEYKRQHCKKNKPHVILNLFPYKKDGLLLNDKSRKCKEMQGNDRAIFFEWCRFLGHKVEAYN